MRQQAAAAHRKVRTGLGAGEIYQERQTMSNTPNDDILFELIKEHFDLDRRPLDTVIDRTGRFQDAARYRDFAAAVLAKWGTPQPVAREPLSDDVAQHWLAQGGKDA